MISKPLLALSSSAVLLGFMLASAPASAQALKTAKLCNDEYAAQKPALKAAKEMKKEFVTACRALPVGTATPVGSVPAAAATPAPAQTTAAAPATASGQVKSAGACDAEYKANRGALRDAKEKKKDFIAACRALPPGAATPIGTAATTSAPAQPAPPPIAPASRQQAAPAPYTPPAPAPAQTTRAQPTSTPSGANQFAAEAGAKARCPAATVVWVNTQSKIYHFAGTKNYGNTKAGAYMCETDATAVGDRASETEKHP